MLMYIGSGCLSQSLIKLIKQEFHTGIWAIARKEMAA